MKIIESSKVRELVFSETSALDMAETSMLNTTI